MAAEAAAGERHPQVRVQAPAACCTHLLQVCQAAVANVGVSPSTVACGQQNHQLSCDMAVCVARRAAGEDPLPEEDPQQFKPIPEPNPLDSYLLLNQVANMCDQLCVQSTQTLEKLYLVEGLQQR